MRYIYRSLLWTITAHSKIFVDHRGHKSTNSDRSFQQKSLPRHCLFQIGKIWKCAKDRMWFCLRPYIMRLWRVKEWPPGIPVADDGLGHSWGILVGTKAPLHRLSPHVPPSLPSKPHTSDLKLESKWKENNVNLNTANLSNNSISSISQNFAATTITFLSALFVSEHWFILAEALANG